MIPGAGEGARQGESGGRGPWALRSASCGGSSRPPASLPPGGWRKVAALLLGCGCLAKVRSGASRDSQVHGTSWGQNEWGLNPSPRSPAYQASRGGASFQKGLETWAEPPLGKPCCAVTSTSRPVQSQHPPPTSPSGSDLLHLALRLVAIVSNPSAGQGVASPSDPGTWWACPAALLGPGSRNLG